MKIRVHKPYRAGNLSQPALILFTHMQLRQYQSELATNIAIKLSQGKRRVVAQLATGGGKTISFSAITKRYIDKSKRSVLITVHREELLRQTVKTLHRAYGITAEIVSKDMQRAEVYVSMVETLNNRLKKNPNAFPDVGLVIFDECHIANHLKILDYFPEAYILGFTATPISASKKRPLCGFFEDIVCGIDIPELIAGGNLVKNVTINPKGAIDRKALSVKNGEFDDKQMGAEYSKAKQVENTLRAYEEFALGTKTVIFNCNIAHSKTVNERFLSAGYNSRHLDAGVTPEYRKECIEWLKHTPDAILNNVGILTTGFDEPSIHTIMVNKDTLSLPLWLQMCGRGARLHPGKNYFNIIDLGSNATSMGDWDFARDWAYMFHNPKKAGDGVAPVKECPECYTLCHASLKQCKGIKADETECTYIFPERERVEMPVEFQIFSQNINVAQIIKDNEHRKEYYPFFQIPKMIANRAKKDVKELNDDLYNDLLTHTNKLCREWCHEKGKKYNQFHKERAEETLLTSLKTIFKWQPQQSESAIITA